jgi:hypothetical protein
MLFRRAPVGIVGPPSSVGPGGCAPPIPSMATPPPASMANL